METLLALSPPIGVEWIVILLVLVLLFGAKKLPELGGSVGKSIRNFKQGIEEGKDDESPTSSASASSSETGENVGSRPRDQA
ncbi:MAG: twin-arginine translocase TatA/TatE family subunit [Egibacteraceae bacterium]